MSLTEAQKSIKAMTKIEALQLDENLDNLKAKINVLFNDAPVAVEEATSKEELEALVSAIKEGTATNKGISRFLELASTLGL